MHPMLQDKVEAESRRHTSGMLCSYLFLMTKHIVTVSKGDWCRMTLNIRFDAPMRLTTFSIDCPMHCRWSSVSWALALNAARNERCNSKVLLGWDIRSA